LRPDRLIFGGTSLPNKKLYWLHDVETGHYNVIAKIKAAMAKRFTVNACDALYNITHTCDKAFTLCTSRHHIPKVSRGFLRYVQQIIS
jgi:hypothetical protein